MRLLNCAALLGALYAALGESPSPARVIETDREPRLSRATLHFEVFPSSKRIEGKAVLKLANIHSQNLVLDLDSRFIIHSIKLGQRRLTESQWRHHDGKIHISLPPKKGTALITVRYSGSPKEAVDPPWKDGFVWKRTTSGQPWIATTSQFTGCDLFWPCLDKPTGEVGLLDTFVTVPSGLSAPGNGQLVGKRVLPSARTQWHWRARQLNPYLFSLQIGPYRRISGTYSSIFGNSFPIEFWFLPGNDEKARKLHSQLAEFIDYFEQTLGPYPFSREKVGVAETPYYGLEHQTINGYGANYPDDSLGFDTLMHHELAHEWFGNQMTARNWDDFWLHEGYATYMQALYAQFRSGDDEYRKRMQFYRGQVGSRNPLISGRPRIIDDLDMERGRTGPGIDVYNKGAWVLHTLRYLIGDAAFFALTKEVLYGRRDPRPGNFRTRFTSSAEFEQVAARVSGQKLDWFFDAYLRGTALPALTQSRTGNVVTLKWSSVDGQSFEMPIELLVGQCLQTLQMPKGIGSFSDPEDETFVIDPYSKILRKSRITILAPKEPAARPKTTGAGKSTDPQPGDVTTTSC